MPLPDISETENCPKITTRDQHVVNCAVSLSLVEITLGGILHAFRVPLSGHLLSLNQGLFLGNNLNLSQNDPFEAKPNRLLAFRDLLEISLVVSFMKALSPGTKKLGPMISIAVQGLLYGMGILIAGCSLPGKVLGMILLSLWGFIQPLITALVLFGWDLIPALEHFLIKTSAILFIPKEIVLYSLGLAVFLKILLSASIPLIAPKISPTWIRNFSEKLTNRMTLRKSAMKKSDMIKPGLLKSAMGMKILFLVSVLAMILTLWSMGFSEKDILLKTIRVTGLALLLSYGGRSTLVRSLMARAAGRFQVLDRLSDLSGKALRKISPGTSLPD